MYSINWTNKKIAVAKATNNQVEKPHKKTLLSCLIVFLNIFNDFSHQNSFFLTEITAP